MQPVKVFGRLKAEMFYGRNWNHVSIDDLLQCRIPTFIGTILNPINNPLVWLNPVEYRIWLGQLGPRFCLHPPGSIVTHQRKTVVLLLRKRRHQFAKFLACVLP